MYICGYTSLNVILLSFFVKSFPCPDFIPRFYIYIMQYRDPQFYCVFNFGDTRRAKNIDMVCCFIFIFPCNNLTIIFSEKSRTQHTQKRTYIIGK